jgi:hypothetical protein
MPDGDIYHNNLPERYQQIYRQIGEGHHPLEIIAYQALTPLRQDLRYYGDPPIQFLLNVAGQIAPFMKEPLFMTNAARDALKQSIEQQLRRVYGDQRAKQLAWHVIEHHLNQSLCDCSVSTLAHILVKQYILRVYVSRCESRVTVPPKASATPLQLSHEEIVQQFAQMHPHIETSIDPFVDHIIHKGTTQGLRLPRGPMEAPVSLDEDLTAPRRS